MMMRGTKEQHDRLFQKLKGVVTLPTNAQSVHKSSRQGKSGQDSTQQEYMSEEAQEGTTSTGLPDVIKYDLQSTRVLQGDVRKERLRFDQRIGGWRRVYTS
jgi:hypothetical protein